MVHYLTQQNLNSRVSSCRLVLKDKITKKKAKREQTRKILLHIQYPLVNLGKKKKLKRESFKEKLDDN